MFLVLVQERAYAALRADQDGACGIGLRQRARRAVSRLHPAGTFLVPVALTLVFQTPWVIGIGRNSELWRDWGEFSRTETLFLALWGPFWLGIVAVSAWGVGVWSSVFQLPLQSLWFVVGASAFVQAAFSMLPLSPLPGYAIVRAFDAESDKQPAPPGRSVWPALVGLTICGVGALVGLDPVMWLLDEVAGPLVSELITWLYRTPSLDLLSRWLIL